MNEQNKAEREAHDILGTSVFMFLDGDGSTHSITVGHLRMAHALVSALIAERDSTGKHLHTAKSKLDVATTQLAIVEANLNEWRDTFAQIDLDGCMVPRTPSEVVADMRRHDECHAELKAERDEHMEAAARAVIMLVEKEASNREQAKRIAELEAHIRTKIVQRHEQGDWGCWECSECPGDSAHSDGVWHDDDCPFKKLGLVK